MCLAWLRSSSRFSSLSLSLSHPSSVGLKCVFRTAPSSSLSLAPSPCLWILTKPTRVQHHHLCFTSADASGGGLSVFDGELESRGFRVQRTVAWLDVEALNEVFARVGFPRREPAWIQRVLEHASGAVVWVEDAKQKAEGRPVVFARATGDGVFNAVVWDVVVEPSFQGMGLGRAVMERLVAELRGMSVSNIALYIEPRPLWAVLGWHGWALPVEARYRLCRAWSAGQNFQAQHGSFY